MTCSLISPVIAFRALAQITLDSSSARQRTPLELFALVLFGLIVFVALTGLLALLGRRALAGPTHAHRHHRPFVPSGWGLDRGMDPDSAAAESVPHPPALQPGISTESEPSGAGVARGRAHVPASPRPPLG
jgi:hypothetical protein